MALGDQHGQFNNDAFENDYVGLSPSRHQRSRLTGANNTQTQGLSGAQSQNSLSLPAINRNNNSEIGLPNVLRKSQVQLKDSQRSLTRNVTNLPNLI